MWALHRNEPILSRRGFGGEKDRKIDDRSIGNIFLSSMFLSTSKLGASILANPLPCHSRRCRTWRNALQVSTPWAQSSAIERRTEARDSDPWRPPEIEAQNDRVAAAVAVDVSFRTRVTARSRSTSDSSWQRQACALAIEPPAVRMQIDHGAVRHRSGTRRSRIPQPIGGESLESLR